MKKSSVIIFGPLLIAMLVLASSPSESASGEIIKWKAQTLFGKQDTSFAQAKIFTDEVYKKTGGKLVIDWFGPGDLVPPPEMISSCGAGVVEMIMTGFPFDSNWIPEAMVAMGLPGSWQTYDQCMKYFKQFGALEFFRESYAKQNLYLLGPIPFGRFVYMTGSKKLGSPFDMKGLKVWGRPPMAFVTKELGGQHADLPNEELYMALKLGTIDGMTYSIPELKTMGFYEVVKYLYKPAPIKVGNIEMSISMSAWKALGPELQKEVQNVFENVLYKMYKTSSDMEEDALIFFKSKGGTVVEWSANDMVKMRAVYDKVWNGIASKDARNTEAIEILRNFVKAEGIK
ncbi:MAG: TRAP transporter substrate-binding protein DctP [bacterium]